MPSTYQSNIINAPIDKVWRTISNFHDMSWAPNIINSVDAVGDVPGTEVGSKRVLNGAIHETLIEIDADSHQFRYTIDAGPEPISPSNVSNYIGEVRLTPVTMQDITLMEWSSSWDSDETEAVSFCHNIYVALMSDMAETFS